MPDPARHIKNAVERALASLRESVGRCIAPRCGPHYFGDDSDGFARARCDADGEPLASLPSIFF
jgi:hypothetical protein